MFWQYDTLLKVVLNHINICILASKYTFIDENLNNYKVNRRMLLDQGEKNIDWYVNNLMRDLILRHIFSRTYECSLFGETRSIQNHNKYKLPLKSSVSSSFV